MFDVCITVEIVEFKTITHQHDIRRVLSEMYDSLLQINNSMLLIILYYIIHSYTYTLSTNQM